MEFFDVLLQYKDKLQSLFYNNQNLLKYLYYDCNEPLKMPEIEDFMSTPRIFFETKDIDTIEYGGCLLFIKLKTRHKFGYTQFLKTNIFFDIFVDSKIAFNDENRWIKIAKEIDKMIGNKYSVWVGKAKLVDAIPIRTNGGKMEGRRLIYETDNISPTFSNAGEI